MDYYKVLKCERTDPLDKIKRNYRKLALKYHPDKNPNGEEQFKRIAEAYEVLSDPISRKEYDKTGVFVYNYDKKDPMQTFREVFKEMPEEVTDALKTMVQKVSNSREYSLLKLVYNSMPNSSRKSLETRATNFAQINEIPKEFINIVEPLFTDKTNKNK